MSDSERRRKARDGAASGDFSASVAVDTRSGFGLIGHLGRFIGQWVYLEGYKMNYRGVLLDVIPGTSNADAQLVFSPLFRVGEWGDEPDGTYEEEMESSQEFPRIVPFGSVTDFGLMQAHWPKSAATLNPRPRRPQPRQNRR